MIPTPTDIEATRELLRGPRVDALIAKAVDVLEQSTGYPVHVSVHDTPLDIIGLAIAQLVAHGWRVDWHPGEYRMVIMPEEM